MNAYARNTRDNRRQTSAGTVTRKRRGDGFVSRVVDNRPEDVAQRHMRDMLTNSPRVVAQRRLRDMLSNSPGVIAQSRLQELINTGPHENAQGHNIDGLVDPRSEGTPAQRRERADLLSRGKQGQLKDGEVEFMRRPDVGPMSVPDLAHSLKPVSNSSATPVADALNSKAASISNGRVQMEGIDGSADPASIAQRVGELRPRDTRIQHRSGGRFEVQAKLNPWVSVLTGRALPELDPPQDTPEDGALHPTKPGVKWQLTASSVEPLKQYKTENTYEAFMSNLAEIDGSTAPPKEKQAVKARLLAEFHHHLKVLPLSEIRKFGAMLQENIETHDKSDSLDKAFDDNRAIYRAWHKPGRISKSDEIGAMVEGGKELVGADSLNVARNPARFRAHKSQSRESGSELVPLGAVPSSMLYSGQKNTVFLKDRGTATALLPENLYAGLSAYNETVKALLREKESEELGAEAEDLRKHAELMRASVTRPVFYDKDDIQSSTGAYEHEDKPGGPHVRKTHSALGTDHNPLRESLELKLADPLRANALFYQTFTRYSKANPHADQWNEMVVKYRATGHTAGLHEEVRDWVPGLQPHQTIYDKLEDSGKYSEDKARQEAEFLAPLVGKNFDPQKEKKLVRGKKGRGASKK